MTQIGFVEGDTVEVLLTTMSQEGIPNVAPMGVWVGKRSMLTIRPYDGTQTAVNIERTGEAVINLSQDPELFLMFAFKEELPPSQQVVFEPAKTVKVPRLRGVSGFVEVTAKPQQPTRSMVPYKQFVCTVQYVELTNAYPLVHSRTRSAAIECVIHATKIRALCDTDPDSIPRLAHQIDELHAFVDRIAPNSTSAKIIRQVESLLKKWIK